MDGDIGRLEVLVANIQEKRIFEKFGNIFRGLGPDGWMTRICFSIYFSCFAFEGSADF